MTHSRRDFIQLGVSLSALGAVPVCAAGRRPEAVVFDERAISGQALARDARDRGLRAHAIRGDVTDLWFHQLEPRWRHRPMTIAGLTAHSALFCLEMLARDRGMRLVFHGPPSSDLLARWGSAGVPMPFADGHRTDTSLSSWVLAPRT